MNKFRLTIRRFLIIRGLGSGNFQTGEGVGNEPLSLPVEQHRRREEGTECIENSSCPCPPGMALYHLLMVQSINPGAEKFWAKWPGRKVRLSGCSLLGMFSFQGPWGHQISCLSSDHSGLFGSACDPEHSSCGMALGLYSDHNLKFSIECQKLFCTVDCVDAFQSPLGIIILWHNCLRWHLNATLPPTLDCCTSSRELAYPVWTPFLPRSHSGV